MNTLIEETLVARLLRDYLNEAGTNFNLAFAGDISQEELQQQLYLLDEEYASKIIKAVLD